MSDVADQGQSRGQFFRNAGKGGIVLATSGGILATVTGSAFAASGPTSSDITALQAAYTAESLAVIVYSTIIKNYSSFKNPTLEDADLDKKYLVAALKNESDHKAFLASALGSKTPQGLKFKIPASAVSSGKALLATGVALETAFVEAYLGASNTLSSADLRLIASKVAANEAAHFGFFDAAAGGTGTLPSIPLTATIPQTVKKLQPFIA
jgi:hypothetical protein